MPKKVVKSVLAGKVKPNVVKARAGDETSYGYQDLPGGLTGIAQLVDCRFDLYKKGANKDEPFFYAAGVLVAVDQSQYQHLVGQRTSVTMAACATKKQNGEVTSQEDNVASIMNEMRKLGASTAEVNDAGDLEVIAAGLLEVKPFFRFSTSQAAPTTQYPNPRVWHNWNGVKGLENYSSPEADGAVQDDGDSADDSDSGDEAPPESADEGDDVRTLAGAADDGDAAAAAQLTEMAVQAGISEDDVANAASWSAVADMIQGAGSDEGDNAAKEPEVGEVWDYKPPKAKKAVSCEVVAVNAKASTVNLKNLDDNKTVYKGVKFTDLVT